MNFETVVNDVKTRVEDVSNRAQSVAELSFQTVRKANDIVVPTFQGIVERQSSAVRELVDSGLESVERVRADGLKAVAANPIEYIPNGRDVVFGAFNASFELTTKAGNDLADVLRKAFEDAVARINGKPAKPAKKARPAARKTAGTARKATAKRATAKSASKARKTTSAKKS